MRNGRLWWNCVGGMDWRRADKRDGGVKRNGKGGEDRDGVDLRGGGNQGFRSVFRSTYKLNKIDKTFSNTFFIR